MRRLALLAVLASLTSGCGDCWDHDHHHDDDFDSGPRRVVVRPGTLAEAGVTPFRTVDSTGTTTFETGPASPPYGVGSVEFALGANGGGAEELRFDVLDGVLLDDVTQLSYWTYVDVGSGQQAAYLILRVDWDGNGTQDDLLFFEPDYQHGYTTDVPDQGDLVLDTWQSWDALAGGWWSLNDPAFPAGAGVDTIETYLLSHPLARVVPGTDGSGGLRLVAGYGLGAWDGFVGNADGLRVGELGDVVTFDLEP
jgi:hypothetical protein